MHQRNKQAVLLEDFVLVRDLDLASQSKAQPEHRIYQPFWSWFSSLRSSITRLEQSEGKFGPKELTTLRMSNPIFYPPGVQRNPPSSRYLVSGVAHKKYLVLEIL